MRRWTVVQNLVPRPQENQLNQLNKCRYFQTEIAELLSQAYILPNKAVRHYIKLGVKFVTLEWTSAPVPFRIQFASDDEDDDDSIDWEMSESSSSSSGEEGERAGGSTYTANYFLKKYVHVIVSSSSAPYHS